MQQLSLWKLEYQYDIISFEEDFDMTINVSNEGEYTVIQYEPQGVCSKLMRIKLKNTIIEDAEIIGGCSGNLQGIGRLIKGMDINDVVKRLHGIPCGSRQTSCPDQLATALQEYITSRETVRA